VARKTHKGQHYVPDSYLKAWCDPACPAEHEPYVWVFNRDGTLDKPRSPSNIFKENDFYTIYREDGSRDIGLENALSRLESKFSAVRRDKLDKQLQLSEQEHADLAVFVAAGQFRTRSSRDHHAGQWKATLNLMDELAERMENATPEQREAAAKISSISASSKGGLTHEQVRKLTAMPIQTMIPSVLRTVSPILAKMNMLILCTDDEVGFLTSDRPVTWYDPEAYKRPPLYRAPGLGIETIEVTMPLSPRQCLLFSWLGPEGYIDASELALNELNRRHRSLCLGQYVVRSNARRDYWFKEFEPPDDAWEKQNPDREPERVRPVREAEGKEEAG
jgi:hypothetical protein